MSQRNYVNNCPKIIGQYSSEAIDVDVNVWGGRRQATPASTLTGFVRTDCNYEETIIKSYYVENSSVRQVPQGQIGYDLWQQ